MPQRLLTLEQKRYFVGLLELVCEKLELSATLKERAENSYEAVGRWLGRSPLPMLYDASIYPQGSMRIQTTVRPLGFDEFDIDLVCHLSHTDEISPGEVREIVRARLYENETYRPMLQPLNRGWRLNYAGEFHMDITPAIDDPNHNGSGVLVPDRELRSWSESNPEGYATWFDEIAEDGTRMIGLEPIVINEDLQPLPDQIRLKGPLRRIVQILKRHRDIYFERSTTPSDKAKPISIILTTLSAHSFRDLVMKNIYDNELDLLFDVVAHLTHYIERVMIAPGQTEWWILNPTNLAENFAEKWNKHPERAEAFFRWLEDLQRELQNLVETAGTGMDSVGAELASLLGETVSQQVMNECTNRVNAHRENRTVKVATSGMVGVGASEKSKKIPKNTFYGD